MGSLSHSYLGLPLRGKWKSIEHASEGYYTDGFVNFIVKVDSKPCFNSKSKALISGTNNWHLRTPRGCFEQLGAMVLQDDQQWTSTTAKSLDLVRIASLAICSWESLVEDGEVFGVCGKSNEGENDRFGGLWVLAGRGEEDIQYFETWGKGLGV
ncbi:hypothetical protein Tco_0326877 [Tanacetum coccineum]